MFMQQLPSCIKLPHPICDIFVYKKSTCNLYYELLQKIFERQLHLSHQDFSSFYTYFEPKTFRNARKLEIPILKVHSQYLSAELFFFVVLLFLVD